MIFVDVQFGECEEFGPGRWGRLQVFDFASYCIDAISDQHPTFRTRAVPCRLPCSFLFSLCFFNIGLSLGRTCACIHICMHMHDCFTIARSWFSHRYWIVVLRKSHASACLCIRFCRSLVLGQVVVLICANPGISDLHLGAVTLR